jgi:hypothetical protein
MTPQATHALLTAAIVIFVVWRLYKRVRRSLGRQRLQRVRPWITVTVFPLLLLLAGLGSLARPLAASSLLGGAAAGIALGVLGLRLTRFEVTPEGLFYTPSAHLGIALSTLLVCRVAYRFATHGLPGTPGAAPATPALTPLTLLLLGTLAGYYCTYAIGLLRWSLRARAATPEGAPSAPGP